MEPEEVLPVRNAAPRRRAPPEQRRAQILIAALGCFARKGYHAATMDDLASASGLSKGSLYWHFRSKDDVFLALFDAFAAELFADWDALAAGGEPTAEVLRRVGELTIERLGSESGLLRAWLEFFAHPEARERLAGVYRTSRAKIAAAVRRDVERGTLRPLDPEGLAAALTAALEGLMLQAMVDEDFDIQAHWPVMWEALYRGIAP